MRALIFVPSTMVLLVLVGCGGSGSSEAITDLDELTAYVEAHPEGGVQPLTEEEEEELRR
ncbi:hypothetical protein [Aporhodopirellula aestuarii]|uniref:Secreted protein n=1 Tax=Aporhodopirellula aestuarii TaxID=2950107 RepID=A0ABT0UB79_9BACT|nr:hypothetical protein [Aporhodopirellula aestuarii]MCM2373643.1 hypothetical protein [Aporhodopirellula aestuarii]